LKLQSLNAKGLNCSGKAMKVDPQNPSTGTRMSIEEAMTLIGHGPAQYLLFAVCGMTIIADASEITFLAFATMEMRCEWGLTANQESMITSAVFIGMGLGSPFWGVLSDKMGRRIAFLSSVAVIAGCGLLTAASQNYWQLLLALGATGVGIAGIPIAFDIVAEACDIVFRGRLTISLQYWWTAGCVYVNLCAWLTVNYGWRCLAVLAALPPLTSLFLAMLFLPESPRWLVMQRRTDEATEILNKWANQNGLTGRPISSVEEEGGEGDAGFIEVWTNPHVRKDYWLMSWLWPAFGLCYWGIIMLLPRLFQKHDGDETGDGCHVDVDFVKVLLSASAEVLGVFSASMMIDRGGRKLVQSVGYGVCSVAALFLVDKRIGQGLLTFVAAAGRCGIGGASVCTWVHTPELFPTRLRSSAHGLLNAKARIGGFFAPFLVQKSVPAVARSVIMASVALLASAVSLCLTETAGKPIGHANVNDEEEHTLPLLWGCRQASAEPSAETPSSPLLTPRTSITSGSSGTEWLCST
jgi:MFS family permease